MTDYFLLSDEENLTETVLKKAAKAVGSLSEKEFNISFNPDLYQSKVTHLNPTSESLHTDKQLLSQLAEFLVFHQIPAFVSVLLTPLLVYLWSNIWLLYILTALHIYGTTTLL